VVELFDLRKRYVDLRFAGRPPLPINAGKTMQRLRPEHHIDVSARCTIPAPS